MLSTSVWKLFSCVTDEPVNRMHNKRCPTPLSVTSRYISSPYKIEILLRPKRKYMSNDYNPVAGDRCRKGPGDTTHILCLARRYDSHANTRLVTCVRLARGVITICAVPLLREVVGIDLYVLGIGIGKGCILYAPTVVVNSSAFRQRGMS